MARVLKQKMHTARKDYYCDASRFITESGNIRSLTFTFSEWREIIKARNNDWKILKGQKYIRQSIIQYGDFYDNKLIPSIHDICCKYNYYQE